MKLYLYGLLCCSIAYSVVSAPRPAHVHTPAASVESEQKTKDKEAQLKLALARSNEKLAAEIMALFEQYRKLLWLENRKRSNGLLKHYSE